MNDGLPLAERGLCAQHDPQVGQAGRYQQLAQAGGVAQMAQMQMKAAAFRLRWCDQLHAAAPFDYSLV
jgi:hypothetical protein